MGVKEFFDSPEVYISRFIVFLCGFKKYPGEGQSITYFPLLQFCFAGNGLVLSAIFPNQFLIFEHRMEARIEDLVFNKIKQLNN